MSERLETLLQKKQLKPPVEKYCEFETKNGRFSPNVVSNTERFTTAGSTSTWPKSGFTVASRVRFDVMFSFTSPPARKSVSRLEWKGSLAAIRSIFAREVTYGTISTWRGREVTTMPFSVPKYAGPPNSFPLQ